MLDGTTPKLDATDFANWYSLWSFGIFYGHLVFLLPFWYIFPLLVCCTMKNLATLDAFKEMLRLEYLQLQRQRCSRLERFIKADENLLVFKTHQAL
jgi:hypothetical protein